MEQATVPKFYTAQQVSEMTGLGTDWLWRQAREHKIPHHKLGGRYRWTNGDLAALARQTAVAVAVPGDAELIPSRLG